MTVRRSIHGSAVAAILLLACSSSSSSPGASNDAGADVNGSDSSTSDVPAADTAPDETASDSSADAPKLASYAPCDSSDQCPTGEDCLAPFPDVHATCRAKCGKPAGTDTTCPVTETGTAECFTDLHCGVYCDVPGTVARCSSSETCHPATSGSLDGLCCPL